ncbi:MAG: hypothetical protein PHF67_03915 [Candidatus Nanoarchaeia archaeon]|nr:hypothetical protein [Candidatus Nanoarchaeia archaeon]
MNKKILAWILQLPLLIIMIASFFASIYAAIKKIGGINSAVPFILGIVIVLYFYGRYLQNKPREIKF